MLTCGYRTIPGERIAALARERLLETGKGLRLPAFRPGKVPLEELERRFGTGAREAVRTTFAVEAAQQLLDDGNLTSATEAKDSADSGDMFLRLTVTHLPALPDLSFDSVPLVRLTSDNKEASAMLEASFRRRLLDRMDASYKFTIAPVLINKEEAAIRAGAREQLALLGEEERPATQIELDVLRVEAAC